MCEENPLRIPSPVSKSSNGNPRGRPRKQQSVTFSAPPKSIVSQLIQKMIIEKNVVLPIDLSQKETSLDNSDHIIESNQAQELASQSVMKKKPKLYVCDFSNCEYSTKLSSNLLKHKRRHTEEKPYLCDICSFRTNFSNSLKVHKRLHTSVRPYKCKNCDYNCNSVSNLKKHTYSKHKSKNCVLTDIVLEAKEEKLELI